MLPQTLLIFALAPFTIALDRRKKPQRQIGAQFISGKTAETNNIGNNLGQNTRYTANITVNGQAVIVFADTGSSDLWIKPPHGIGTFNQTEVTTNLTYGDGSASVFGHVGLSSFQFGAYKVEQQAFLNAEQASAAESTEFALGIYGILGLGLDDTGSSRINAAVQKKYGAGATWGRSVLSNIFASQPNSEKFIAMSLSRTENMEGTAGGSLTIGEHDPTFSSFLQNASHLNQFPPSSGRWTTLIDGLVVTNATSTSTIFLGTSSVNAVQQGKLVGLLDSGTTNMMLPPKTINSIYSRIPGAVFSRDTPIPRVTFSTDDNIWIVPCKESVEVTLLFRGQKVPIHPLDLTDMHIVQAPDEQKYTVCTSAFTNVGSIGGTEFDVLLGASFLRNTYTVFNFGSSKDQKKPTPAFVQLVPRTNARNAADQLLAVRNTTMGSMPPELAPGDLLALFGKQATALDADNFSVAPVNAARVPHAAVAVVVVLVVVLLGVFLILLGIGIFVWRRERVAGVGSKEKGYKAVGVEER